MMFSIKIAIVCLCVPTTVCIANSIIAVTRNSVLRTSNYGNAEKVLYALCPYCDIGIIGKEETHYPTYRIDFSVSVAGNSSDLKSLSLKFYCALCNSLNISLNFNEAKLNTNGIIKNISLANKATQNISVFFSAEIDTGFNIFMAITDDKNQETIYNKTLEKSSGCSTSHPLPLIFIPTEKHTAAPEEEISFNISIIKNSTVNNSTKLEIFFAIPENFLPLKRILCTPLVEFQNTTISNYFVMNTTVELSQITCEVSTVIGSIPPGGMYETMVFAAHKQNDSLCLKFGVESLRFVASEISLLYDLSVNPPLSPGDKFHVTLILVVPEISLRHLVIKFTFEEENTEILTTRNPFIYLGVYAQEILQDRNLPFQALLNGIAINITDIPPNGNLTIFVQMGVENKSLTTNFVRGRLKISSYFMQDTVIPITISDGMGLPLLEISKDVQVYGDEEIFLRVTLSVRHTNESRLDAYNVRIFDKVMDMHVINRKTIPSTGIDLFLIGTVGNLQIYGSSAMLKVGQSVSVAYTAKYILKSQINVFKSQAMVSWQSPQTNGANYGPAYSEVVCVKQNLLYRDGFIQNYGFIFLGIVMGVIGGVLIAVVIILCARRHPNIKKYVLHTNEIEDVKDEEEKQSQDLPDYFSTIEPIPKEKVISRKSANKQGGGFLRGFSKRFSVKLPSRHNKGPIKSTEEDTLMPSIHTSFMQLEYNSILHIQNTSAGYVDVRWVNICSDIEMSLYLPYQLPWQQECAVILKMAQDCFIQNWVQLVNDEVSEACKQQNVKIQDVKTDRTDEFTANNLQENKSDKNGNNPCTAAEILNIFQVGMTYYDKMLKQIVKEPTLKSTGRRENGRVKESNEEELVQLKEEYLKMLQERNNSVKEKFSKLFGDFLDALYHISGVRIGNQMLMEFSLLALVPSKNCFELVYNWLGDFVSGELFQLRKKHAITQVVYSEFERTFKNELIQITTHLQKAKIKIVERDEELLMANYRNHMKTLVKNLNSHGSNLSQVSRMNVSPMNTQRGITTYRFQQCCESADCWKKCAGELHDILKISNYIKSYLNFCREIPDKEKYCTLGIVDTQTKLCEHVRQASHVFLSRMKVHAREIHRENVDEIVELPTADSDFNLREISTGPQPNNLLEMIEKVEPTIKHFLDEFQTGLERREIHLKEQCEEFDDYFKNLLMKKKNELKEIKILCKLLFKSTIQACGPLDWCSSQKIIQKVPGIFLEAILRRFLLDETFSNKEIPKDMNLTLKIVEESLVKKHDVSLSRQNIRNQPIEMQLKTINNKVLDEIEQRVEELKSRIKTGFDISENDDFVEKLIGGSNEIMGNHLQSYGKEVLVKISSNFLLSIIREQSTTTLEEKPPVHDGLKEFQKSMKQILRQAENEKTMEEGGEVQDEVKDTRTKEIKDYLHNYISMCDVFSCDIEAKNNADNAKQEEEEKENNSYDVSTIYFDTNEIVKHLIRLSEFSKCLDNRVETLDKIIDQNFSLITCLKQHDVANKQDMAMFVKDLSMNTENFEEFEQINQRLSVNDLSMVEVLRTCTKKYENGAESHNVRKRVKKPNSTI